MRIFHFALAVLLLSPCFAPAQPQPPDVATRRAHLLQRGVNASLWFAQAEDYSPARLRSYITADDIALMHSMGFDHVRVSVDGDELVRGAPPNGLNAPFVAELDRAVNIMLKDGLRVIVDVHPSDEFKRRVAHRRCGCLPLLRDVDGARRPLRANRPRPGLLRGAERAGI